mgnify:CR=1 FL=1
MASVSEVQSASNLQMDYMQLLTTQLRHQNPLEPMDNNQMAMQLAQFSQLQQLENMNTSFSDALANANRTYANSLIGKKVSFADGNSEDGGITNAVVDGVVYGSDGEIFLMAGNRQFELDDVLAVAN